MRGAKFREVLVSAIYRLGMMRVEGKARVGVKRFAFDDIHVWTTRRLIQGGPTPERLRFTGAWRVSCNLAKTLGDKHVLVRPGPLLELLDYVEGRAGGGWAKEVLERVATHAKEAVKFDPRSVTFKPYNIGRKP